jgi:hypothetical protein
MGETPEPVIGIFTRLQSGISTFASSAVIPYLNAVLIYPSGTFALNGDGTVTINETGLYQIDVSAQTTEPGAIQILVNGSDSLGFNSAGIVAVSGGTMVINTIISLSAGDIISLQNLGNASLTLTTTMIGVNSSQTTMRIVKLK